MEETRYSSWMLERVDIGDTVRLRVGFSTIGRHSSCVIRILDSAFVSRHHAKINVAEDDRKVYITDLNSVNGIFVNDQQYSKKTVEVYNNDLIGIGVITNIDESENVLQLPIFKLKYAPLRQMRQANVNRPAAPMVISTPTPPPSPLGDSAYKSNENDSQKEKDNNSESTDEKPCCSKSIKAKQISLNEDIFEISDDDDFMEKSNNKQEHLPPKQIEIHTSNEKPKEMQLNLTKLRENQNQKELNFKANTDTEDQDFINPSQRFVHYSPNLTETKEDSLHMPIISSIKKELIRTVSANIQNIFGNLEGDEKIQEKIKEINPLIYNDMHISQKLIRNENDEGKPLANGDLIILTDDDDDVEIEELGTITANSRDNEENEISDTFLKTHNIIDFPLDNSKESTNVKKKNQNKKVSKDQATVTPIDSIDLDEYTRYVPNSNDEDIEDLMFSQVLINDMKAEMQHDLEDQTNLPLPNANANINTNVPVTAVGEALTIKEDSYSESFSSIPKELENSCWIISDDEDYDEELETKVNDWSNKIFSQSFNQLNMSQVYDLNEPDNNTIEGYASNEENNLNMLEDDIDSISNYYINNENNKDNAFDNIEIKLKNLNNNMQNSKEEIIKKLKKKEINRSKDNNGEKMMEVDLVKYTDDKNSSQPKIISAKETSPVKEDNNLVESPIIRPRRRSKTNPVSQSPSSSDDEIDLENKKLSEIKKHNDLMKSLTRIPPPVINAPSLPKHKGKLRGVSAELSKKTTSHHFKTPTLSKKSSIIKELRHEEYTKNLKKKWIETSSIAKKCDKEHKNFIKECRKDKLKKLAERKKSPSKENIKRKLSTEDHEHKSKIAKVKVTTHNRGAFLANNEPILPPPTHGNKTDQFKIPKKLNDTATKKDTLKRSLSIDGFETFSEQICKPDNLLLKRRNIEDKKSDKSVPSPPPPPLRRHSTTDTSKQSICNETIAARAIRTTNKITFASMEKSIEENEEMKRKLSALSCNNTTPLSPLSSIQLTTNLKKSSIKIYTSNTTPTQMNKKKTVRFNDTPVIHYIERISGACKKINNKDLMPMTTHKDRRLLIRNTYPIIDNTDTIISNILYWSNEWLTKRNAAVEAASEVIYPMPTHFNSFDHYKSIVFPLMKLEFFSTLEREYHATQNSKNFKVSLEYATHNKDRIMLVTKLISQNKEQAENSQFDLVILESDKRGPQIFAYAVTIRKGSGTFVTIVYEIIANNLSIEYFKAINEFCVHPVMDKVRVHFGAFNSVYQLQASPLFQKIINPFELLKCKPPSGKKVIYRGYDKLNDKQRYVLLNTYMKIIDESTPNITLIQGPPGTGKSCVITNLVLQTLYGDEVRYLDKKILICAQSNAAVDVIAAKLYDISMRMRPEKRFRLIRYGMLNKIHPNVLPVALQKVVEHDQLKKLQAKNKDIHIENKQNLKNQIMEFEAQVAEMSSRNIKGTVEEDLLLEKQRQLQLMRNILNHNIRPEDERSLFTWYLGNANIVCATLCSCVNLIHYINFFDICIIDEATQCTEPWTLSPLKFGINSLVLVGDTQQLPATVLSKKANELGLGTSMFTRIQKCLDNITYTSVNKDTNTTIITPNNIINSLQIQYRMHPEICRWPNQYFYRNELINAKSTIDFTKSPLMPFSILSLAYTQNDSCSNGKITNNLEAEFVAKLLKALDGFIPNKYNSYGVITPYAHHRATLEYSIRSLGLTNIMVNTIDSYQGLEKDVIVISNARTNGIGFLSNPQRLNVALTRAKKSLIVCGNFKNLETVPAWRCLLENARERKLYHEISVNSIMDIQTNVIEKIKLKNHKPLI